MTYPGRIPNTSELWPGVNAYRIQFKNADGESALTQVIQSPGLTAEQALAHTTDFVRANFIAIHKCQPQH